MATIGRCDRVCFQAVPGNVFILRVLLVRWPKLRNRVQECLSHGRRAATDSKNGQRPKRRRHNSTPKETGQGFGDHAGIK